VREQIQSKKLAVGRKLIGLPVMCSGSLLPIAAIQLWKSGAILGYHFLSGQNALGQKCWSEQRHNFFLLFVLVLSAVSQNQPLFGTENILHSRVASKDILCDLRFRINQRVSA
jgi:hypothetical protein